MPRNTVTHWRSGKRKGPTFRLLSRIAARLSQGLPPSSIPGRFAARGSKTDIARLIRFTTYHADTFYSRSTPPPQP